MYGKHITNNISQKGHDNGANFFDVITFIYILHIYICKLFTHIYTYYICNYILVLTELIKLLVYNN